MSWIMWVWILQAAENLCSHTAILHSTESKAGDSRKISTLVQAAWTNFLPNSAWLRGCLVQDGNSIELEAVGLQFEPYLWLPWGMTWDSSQTVVVLKLLRHSTLVKPKKEVHTQSRIQGIFQQLLQIVVNFGPTRLELITVAVGPELPDDV